LISVNEPWYSLIENKKKTIEGRLNKFGIEKLKKRLTKITTFDTKITIR